MVRWAGTCTVSSSTIKLTRKVELHILMRYIKHMQLQTKIKKTLLVLVLVCSVFLVSYWSKSMLGWNFSKTYQLSNSFPFSLFQRNRLLIPHNEEIIIDQDFDSLSLENIWFLWTKEPNTVHVDRNIALGDKTKSQVFYSDTDDEWSFGFNKLIKVQSNSVFSFSGYLKKNTPNNVISIRISSFDAAQKATNWKFKEKEAKESKNWVFLADEFEINNPKIVYVKFQLIGKGKGEFRFDDIFFSCNLNSL